MGTSKVDVPADRGADGGSGGLLQAHLGPQGIAGINGSGARPIMTQGIGGEPWRQHWPPVANDGDAKKDKPWIGWRPNPDKPGEKPWLVWMNDPRYVHVPNRSY